MPSNKNDEVPRCCGRRGRNEFFAWKSFPPSSCSLGKGERKLPDKWDFRCADASCQRMQRSTAMSLSLGSLDGLAERKVFFLCCSSHRAPVCKLRDQGIPYVPVCTRCIQARFQLGMWGAPVRLRAAASLMWVIQQMWNMNKLAEIRFSTWATDTQKIGLNSSGNIFTMSNLTLSHTPAWLSGAFRWFVMNLFWKVFYLNKDNSSWPSVTSQQGNQQSS